MIKKHVLVIKMQKLFNILSVISLLLTSSVIGGGVYSYFWLKNTDNQNIIKEQLMKEIKKGKNVPVMPITHNKSFPNCRCIEEEKQVFGESFKQVF